MTDLKECLKLISSGDLRPQVELGDLQSYDRVLQDLHAGKIKSRIALVPKL
jgi:alcohol dehydrogenase, propanol-preferring